MYGVQSVAHNNSPPVQLSGFQRSNRTQDPSDLGVFPLELKGGYPYPCSATMQIFNSNRKGLQASQLYE